MIRGEALTVIASAFCDDVVEGLTSSCIDLPCRTVTDLRQCGFDVIGGATERLVVMDISGADVASEIGGPGPVL